MFDFGKHAFFIWGSYGIAAVVLTGLVWWLISDGRRYSSALNRLEDRSSNSGQEKD
ncbi:MAG: heme exporter protein CcmD [Hyphomicrobiaceae bacterium TMED74]|jgi:heme exporter protein CcmD|nr:heme exporter protein CcmD [Filomicrobium sp.]RPG39038.1 MAG: heme exporter protein CcmD [Hyphomicrobiaceae bacterium TMED74]